MYFSKGCDGVIFFDGYRDEFFDDAEIKEMLSSTVVLSSISAKKLIDRGFSEYLGVDVSDILPTDPPPRFEKYSNGEKSAPQKKLKKLILKNSEVEVISEVYTIVNGITPAPIFPAVTAYQNSLGGTVIVFAGSPDTSFTYSEAFSFLCSPRKKQLISLMQKYGEIPVYYPDDAEVYIKAGQMPDGKIFCAFFNIGLDNLDDVTLIADRPINEISMLMPNGKFSPVDYTVSDDSRITVNTPAEILNPVILILG